LCPIPGIYAVTVSPLVNLTLAILRTAEFGFFGVVVVTLVHTPLLNGEEYAIGLFFTVLKPLAKVAERVLFFSLNLGFLMS
jgi:hypothetical protein